MRSMLRMTGKLPKGMATLTSALVLMLWLGGCTGVLTPAANPDDTQNSAQPPATVAAPPANDSPTEVAPIDETPADEMPTDAMPADESPTAETPAGDVSEGEGDTAASPGIQLAERVEFEPGVNSTMRSGTLAVGDDKQYALAASAGQMLHIQTIGMGAPVGFTVYGPGSISWAGEMQPSGAYIFTTQFTVPENADYLVVLTVTDDAPATMPENASEASYEIVFTLDGSVSPTEPQSDPVERIGFDAGTTTTERSGLMPSGPGANQYLLSANVGQTLTVDATSDGTPLSMTIESPSGNQWIPEMMTAPEGYTIGQQITLPEPGYYLVTLAKADHTPSTNFTITFTLE